METFQKMRTHDSSHYFFQEISLRGKGKQLSLYCVNTQFIVVFLCGRGEVTYLQYSHNICRVISGSHYMAPEGGNYSTREPARYLLEINNNKSALFQKHHIGIQNNINKYNIKNLTPPLSFIVLIII